MNNGTNRIQANSVELIKYTILYWNERWCSKEYSVVLEKTTELLEYVCTDLGKGCNQWCVHPVGIVYRDGFTFYDRNHKAVGSKYATYYDTLCLYIRY